MPLVKTIWKAQAGLNPTKPTLLEPINLSTKHDFQTTLDVPIHEHLPCHFHFDEAATRNVGPKCR